MVRVSSHASTLTATAAAEPVAHGETASGVICATIIPTPPLSKNPIFASITWLRLAFRFEVQANTEPLADGRGSVKVSGLGRGIAHQQ